MYAGPLPFVLRTYCPVIKNPPESAAALLVVTVGLTSPLASGPVMIVRSALWHATPPPVIAVIR